MSGKLRQLAIAALILGPALNSFADTVSLDEARTTASEFFATRSGRPVSNLNPEPVFTASEGSRPLFYVFNAADNNGFVIISAESTTTPVIGYSFESPYSTNTVPEAMQWVLSGIQNEIKAAPSLQRSFTTTERKSMVRKAAGETAARKVLSTPSWSQEGPFNNLIPGRPLVGCVGTAMATVMKFHQWPASGTGSFDGVDFNTTYDWSSMRTDNYRSGYSAAEGNAVATLMYHASKSIATQYAMSGSSAYEVRVPGALSTYFGYDPGVSYKKRSEVATQEAWDKIVKAEIDADRPVIYCGQDVTAGHAFVCDGYEGEYLHFNWGWGGSANGFFLSTALNPTVSRTHNYNNLNTIIYNIKPAAGANVTWSPIHITADANQVGIGSDLTNLASGQTFTVRVGNLKNLSYDNFAGQIAVALFDKDGKFKTLLSSPSNFSLQSMATLANGYVDFRGCVLPAGASVTDSDLVRVATCSTGSAEWLPVAGELPTVNELAVSSSAPSSFNVTLPTVAGVKIEGQPSVIRGWNYSFTVTPENTKDDVVTVRANGFVLAPANNFTYTISNVREDQNIAVLVQKASEVKEKRSVWVDTPGTLSSIITDDEAGTIKDLTIFGQIDARDFAFMKNNMRLTRLDLSGAYIAAHGTDQANAIPREAFRGLGALNEVVLPKSVNRLNNGCFRQSGITTITIPAGVKTYEYNIFVSASKLRHIYVGRETAEFINWCVLSGVNTKALTLHVPSERALANYQKAENWKTIANIIVDPIPASNDALFAVMDNSDVNYESPTTPGMIAKGTAVSFKATHVADNDNRMNVYANSTLLTPDAEGVYSVKVADNTLIHFDLVPPTETIGKSQWTLNGNNGSIGMFTDAVNVIPGQNFTVRVNSLAIPKDFDQFFWAIALTDKNDNIKEFISPVNLWSAGPAENHKFNVSCAVKESDVREGNRLRLVTSAMKKNWQVVYGANDSIVDALPALNNVTPVYNINIAQSPDLNISGAVTSAVRGRDINLKVTPKQASNRIDLIVNGKEVLKGQASVNYTFVAMNDIDIDFNVYDPKAEGTVTYNVNSLTWSNDNLLYYMMTADNIAANVVVTGTTYASDLKNAFTQAFVAKTVKKVDLSGLKIVNDPNNGNYKENMIPAEMFYKTSGIGQTIPVLQEIILPDSVNMIAEGAFMNCANLKEITLPMNLGSDKIEVGRYASGSIKYGYPLGYQAFQGCTSLTTIYIPGTPSTVKGRMVVSHFNPYGTYMPDVLNGTTSMYDLGFRNAENKPDGSKITVVVPEEYLSVYRTRYIDREYGNPWQFQGYNILSENPVYGVNFDPTRIVAAEGVNLNAMASFLGDNIALPSLKVEGKLRLANPEIACLVFDNDSVITPEADGSITVEFLNPAKNATGAGNHNLRVVYTHNVAFNSTSPIFSIVEPQVAGTSFGTFEKTDSISAILKNVPENSTVRFALKNESDNSGLEPRLMAGLQELTPDADGFYSINVTNASQTVEIFGVPTEGASLSADEVAALNPAEASTITTIALEGQFTPEQLAQAMETFPSLENLDLSGYEGELPDGAFANMTSLTTVTVPNVEAIGPNTFSGCSSLESVDVPSTVNTIGEGAFSGCTSLQSLHLTSVTSIGQGAFDGCDNMTNITLLAGHDETGSAPSSAPARVAALDAKAFTGLNPNCIVVVDQGVATPAEGVNFITTSTATLTETLPDGSTTEREGRIYTATRAINFVSGHPLAIPHTFTLADDTQIVFTTENEKWNGLVVPFNVATINDANGTELPLTLVADGVEKINGTLAYTLADGAEKLTSVDVIKANVPYIFHTQEKADLVFSAKGISVPSTPAEISAKGKDFALNATYLTALLPVETTYLLSGDAKAFVPATAADNDSVNVELAPFSVYATTDAPVAEILTGLPDTSTIVAADDIATDLDGLTIEKHGDNLVIYSPVDKTETLYSLDGRVVTAITLTAGYNTIKAPASGVYIIANTKVRL